MELDQKVLSDGTQEWYRNGQLHREDGPAVIRPNGTQVWYLNGKLHREGGPAVIGASGTQEWWLNGQLHREDGPAIIWPDGTLEWCRDGFQVTPENQTGWMWGSLRGLRDNPAALFAVLAAGLKQRKLARAA